MQPSFVKVVGEDRASHTEAHFNINLIHESFCLILFVYSLIVPILMDV